MRCYDGCGKVIGGFEFGLRAANRQGEKATRVMERLDAARAAVKDASEGDHRSTRALQRLAHHEELLDKVLTSCREVMHDERSYKEIDWALVRSTLTEAERFISLLLLPGGRLRDVARDGRR